MASFSAFDTDGNEYMSYDGSGRVTPDSSSLVKFKTQDQRDARMFWTKFTGKKAYEGFSMQYFFQKWSYETGHGWLWQIPDLSETMDEFRHIFFVKYTPNLGDDTELEISSRFQNHSIDWNWRVYPDNAFASFGDPYAFHDGGWEYLNTSANDIFGRVQLTQKLDRNASVLAGVETDVFLYHGDREHYSNFDYVSYEVKKNTRQSFSWLYPIEDNPLLNYAVYAQFVSGDMISDDITLTLGLRYDGQSFTYSDPLLVDSLGNYSLSTKENNKSFSKVSPRIALVYMVDEDLSLKAMWGQAFRAPTPTEMFGNGDNTWTLASNIKGLKAEEITTAELAFDWIMNENLNWRTNIFRTEFENQIAYSVQNNNLSTNVYSSTNQGFETEVLFGSKDLSGFANLAYVERVDEVIQDQSIATSSDLTWEPSIKLNFGVTRKIDRLSISLQGHYQDEVKRRDTDKGLQLLPLGASSDKFNMDLYRGTRVDAWFTLDMNTSYQLNELLKLELQIKNLLNTEYHLVKNVALPFDYKQQGQVISLKTYLTL